jgi:alpha-N-arabinofuranosidase
MGLTVVLGVWAGLYLDGTIIAQANLQPYVNSVLNELEFLLVGDAIS